MGDGESLPNRDEILEVITLIRENEKRAEKDELSYYLGKQKPPAPIINSYGTLSYFIEINIDSICESIKYANEVFRALYKWRYYKGTQEIPKEILEIISVYDMMVGKWKSDKNRVNGCRKWLTGIALVGIIRFQGKANSPYMTEKEIQKSVSSFLKCVDFLRDVISGEKIMYDKEKKGLNIWEGKMEGIYSRKRKKAS